MQDPSARVCSFGRIRFHDASPVSRDAPLDLSLADRKLISVSYDFSCSFLPDAVAIIGTMDLVFGEVDR